jgi:hypothetical protein
VNITAFDIEQALRRHQEATNIASWFRGQYAGEYRVRLATGSVLTIRNLFEAVAFTSGLESFAFAQEQRDKAEAARLAAEAAEHEDRLARERVIQQLAVGTVGCETCGSEPGTRCLRDPRVPDPFATKPHKPRIDAALAQQQQLVVLVQPVAA